MSLPHTAVELPFSYFDEASYWRPFTYQKVLTADPAWAGQEVWLICDGAMADAVVYLNGERLGAHADGYTPFAVRLTGKLTGGNDLLAIKIDGSENPGHPALRRAHRLSDLCRHLSRCLAEGGAAGLDRQGQGRNAGRAGRHEVRGRAPRSCQPSAPDAGGNADGDAARPGRPSDRDGLGARRRPRSSCTMDGLDGIALWDLDSPVLYTLDLALGDDAVTHTFGFRAAEFTPEGFRLNGRPLKLRGLNRHQSFPYAGYALGRAAQERDAEILKRELHVNIVRTSHYPQSTWFLDACDRLGLLVLEEIPGWQHIGGDTWKAEAVANVRRMITRDWNHPSIVLWGVRINESQDNHDFYAETNRVAHELDTDPSDRRHSRHHRERDARRRLYDQRLHPRQRGARRQPAAHGAASAARDDRPRQAGALHGHRVQRPHVSDQELSTRSSVRSNM